MKFNKKGSIMRLVLINEIEDGSNIMFVKTNLTDLEIQTAISDEKLDEDNCDYETKLIIHTEKLGKKFKRLDDELETIYV